MYARFHIDKSNKIKKQKLVEHLENVAIIASQKGLKLNFEKTMYLVGLLHDIGKARIVWQNYLFNTSETKIKLPHAIWGAVILKDIFKAHQNPLGTLYIQLLQNVLLSHHSMLKDTFKNQSYEDYLNLYESDAVAIIEIKEYMSKTVLTNNQTILKAVKESFEYGIKEFELNIKKNSFHLPIFTQSLFSILVDADWTDASDWFYQDNRMVKTLTPTLIDSLETSLKKETEHFKATNHINRLRIEISESVYEAGNKEPGIYSLSTPVGAGKTISSLRFALHHAKKYNKERIIYILPFTAIIEQNADEIRKLLHADEWLLEHHNQVCFDNEDTDVKFNLLKSKDDWDAPIIVTTMYQYLMAFYGGKARNMRRLNQCMNSVLIFDEIQSVPTKSTVLFNQTVNFLTTSCASTVLLCTATQPTLDTLKMKSLKKSYHLQEKYVNINKIEPLIKKEYTEEFKRVDFQYIKEIKNTETIIKHIKEQNLLSMLFILNTKKVVMELYNALKYHFPNLPIYHLSTSMCPLHRTDILNKVKEHLKNKELVFCISTPLIEAGVNISFPIVYRSLTKLDSIAQASGRCNRHGELTMGSMFLFEHQDEDLKMLIEVERGRKVTKEMLLLYQSHSPKIHPYFIHPDNIKWYYKRYFEENKINHELVYPLVGYQSIYDLLFNCESLATYKKDNLYSFFTSAFTNYQVYETEYMAVIVPYKKGIEIIDKIKKKDLEIGWQKEAQQYSVNLFKNQLNKMIGKEIEKILLEDNEFVYIAKYYIDSGIKTD